MNVYKNGEFVEGFEGTREYDRLTEFMAKHATPTSSPNQVEVEQPEPPHPSLNPTGTVLALNDSTFHSTLEMGPAFVKFFAPWLVTDLYTSLAVTQLIYWYACT
jgi:thioredoxin domain-containing protein 5